MSYCLNPSCSKPQNPSVSKFCLSCGSQLLLKQYRPIQPIGEGGFGRTFLAEDTYRLNARCVIKQFFPLPQIQGNTDAMAKATQLFAQEARQLLELGEQHLQIPTLFGYFEQDRQLYLVQQFIDGQDLSKELAQGTFDEQKIRALLNDLLPVLQFIHEHQVIHRDIKPTNILRRRLDGKLVLIDFGIAKPLSGNGMTTTGTRAGTEGYAPIEQLRGGKAYPASDLYSLGVTCIRLLCGAELDELYDAQQGIWVWQEYLRQRGKNVSSQMSQVLDKLLKDYVKERYQSAAEVLKDLNAEVSNPVIPVTMLPTPTIQQPTAHGWQCVQTLEGASINAVAISSDELIVGGGSENTVKVWQPTGKLIHTLEGHSNWISAVAISPDGHIASGSADKTIKLWNLASGQLLSTLEGHLSFVSSVAISPDGLALASSSADETIKFWDLENGQLISTLSGNSRIIHSVTFSPDGQILASGSIDGTIKLWDLSNGELLPIISNSGVVNSVAISSDGLIVGGIWDNTVKVWKLSSGQLLHTLQHSDWVNSVAITPDGKILASGSTDTTIKLWHLESGELLSTLEGHSKSVESLAFSFDGQILVSGSMDGTIKIWRSLQRF